MIRYLAACLLVLFGSVEAFASQVTIASWNLGWHMDRETVKAWIRECSKNYVEDPATGKFKPSQEAGFKPGWDIDAFKIEGWDASRLPVCNVYWAGGTVRVNLEAYRRRQEQIANFISGSVPADIIAFQEVSGEQSVREVLPNGGSDYDFCPVTGYKVQRLVIAWKKTLGEKVSCAIEDALSLPANPDDKRPRPGLALTLKIDGKLLRIMDVHLKSSCVSPFDGGNLEGTGKDCMILQQQVDPLESWVERAAADGAKIVLLGDFNRNLWHELRDQRPARTDSSGTSSTRPAGVLSRSLVEEIADGQPAAANLKVLDEHCQVNDAGQSLCTEAEIRNLTTPETQLLASDNYLGCRNPVGLDHILVGPGINSDRPAEHVSIGNLGSNRAGTPNGKDQVLAISDHCPMIAQLNF
ncbi:endonuclease/exonuclease/phosphatase family protein [Sinorhizobium meliloti]|uniref:endonuclease/exonuclease/phosphatase family protein n=1 Tax=Rhizobium meliloti TaxID=382 RepID=UPI00299D8B83|nr:endonuclease/exonuclease/phosphatase family protein [Sinorhizobium meliloti]MDW9620952.1 endonuclease/exonuclease/phosphatase family protein [Sinorhizobium meliloti]MDX0154706.1 endonuclease/exonuclease/phosphatase family protein [Sinorhizobium meliloti]MDX0177656.1 endonuclease/exonuclease/phosphatase family protein [Sinorhizobium meliloti]